MPEVCCTKVEDVCTSLIDDKLGHANRSKFTSCMSCASTCASTTAGVDDVSKISKCDLFSDTGTTSDTCLAASDDESDRESFSSETSNDKSQCTDVEDDGCVQNHICAASFILDQFDQLHKKPSLAERTSSDEEVPQFERAAFRRIYAARNWMEESASCSDSDDEFFATERVCRNWESTVAAPKGRPQFRRRQCHLA